MEKQDLRTLYHITSTDNANSILEKGFDIKNSEAMYLGKGIYTIDRINKYMIRDYGKNTPKIVEIQIPKKEFKEKCIQSSNKALVGTFDSFVIGKGNYLLDEAIKRGIISKKEYNQIEETTESVSPSGIPLGIALKKDVIKKHKGLYDYHMKEYVNLAEKETKSKLNEQCNVFESKLGFGTSQIVIYSKDLLDQLQKNGQIQVKDIKDVKIYDL